MMAVAVVVLEARPLAGALEVVGEPKSAGRRSAAWVVVPMDCLVVVAPTAVLGPKVCPARQLPTDVHENCLPSAGDPEDLQAAAPASVFHKLVMPEAQTASGKVL